MSRNQGQRKALNASRPVEKRSRIAYRRGVTAAEAGHFSEARRHFKACLDVDPFHVEARHDLGVVLLRDGEARAAIGHFRDVLARHPTHSAVWVNLALSFCDIGDSGAAWDAASQAVRLAPASAAARTALGHALFNRGDLDEAERAYRQALDLEAPPPSLLARHAAVLRRLGRFDETLAACERLLAREPSDMAAQAERYLLLLTRDPVEADAQAHRLSTLVVSDGATFRNLCIGLVSDERRAEALCLADMMVDRKPDVAAYRLERASLLHGAGRMAEALDDLKRALAIDITDTEVLFTIGRFFDLFDQPAAASEFFLQVVAQNPSHADAYVQLGLARTACGELGQGIALLRHAIALDPDRVGHTADLCWLRLMACDWNGLDNDFAQSLDAHLKAGRPFAPFTLLAFGISNSDLLMWTRAWGEQHVGVGRRPLARPDRSERPRPHDRIRLGYLSADFKDHATVLLITEMIESHDRERFEVFGYNIGAVDDSPRCRRVLRAFDGFIDLAGLRDDEAARRIADDELDILIDLKGYTKDGRPGIMAHRPASIQVNYLGYPGSMGTPLIDYLIADGVVVPDEHRAFYDEAVVHLPNSYQPNDRHRAGVNATARRGDHGLPPTGFVFCCFNSNYKMTPLVFDIWMRLLRAVPGSVLWSISINQQVQDNLRREAEIRGVPSERLVFAPRMSFEDHIGRMGLADLFLDTLPVCAHTTASEALWAGLPVLTCLGPHFVGRVAGSLLTAVGLPELITTTLAEYESEALALARDPARLGALRDRLARNRLTAPLFDTPRYVRNYEAALERMVERREAGQAPAPFAVDDDAGGEFRDRRALRL
ncbi:MAG: tetratricopeptide repeat protein [Janthinobacterium lividum]